MSAVGGAGPVPTWADLVAQLLRREHLTPAQTSWAMEQMMRGEAAPAQLAGFLVALRAKGETSDELAGLVEVMMAHAVPITVEGPTVDVVGTGGDRHHTVNISTMAAVVVAGAGHRVVKHGNRAASSSTGTADVLEELGVRLDLPPARVQELAHEVGITFCFAQVFHPAFRHAGVVRKDLGVPTAFNALGPLTNPARPGASAIGVADAVLAPAVAGVLAGRGVSAVVFRGDEGLDELSTVGPSQVWTVGGGQVTRAPFDPRDLDLPRATLEQLRGGAAAQNAQVVRDLLAGAHGPVRDTVLLNAAAAIVAAQGIGADEAADPDRTWLIARLRTALDAAARSVDDGSAAAVLEAWVKASRA